MILKQKKINESRYALIGDYNKYMFVIEKENSVWTIWEVIKANNANYQIAQIKNKSYKTLKGALGFVVSLGYNILSSKENN